MNKSITLFILIMFNINVSAQIDFLKFIESTNWNSTESEIVKQYSTIIKKRVHDSNEAQASELNYGINNIILGDYAFNVGFYVNPISKKLAYLAYKLQFPNSKINETPKVLSDNLDALLSEKFGVPDSKVDGEAPIIMNTRIWHNENIIIESIHGVGSGQLYWLKIKQFTKNSFNEMQREERIKAKYDYGISRKIIKREFWLGMTSEMAKESLGNPEDINRTVGSWGVHEQWIYGSSYLYFENGVLTSFQN